jgi:serine/threonine protein kinase
LTECEKKILHRDISVGNILISLDPAVSPGNRGFLVDFDFAKSLVEGDDGIKYSAHHGEKDVDSSGTGTEDVDDDHPAQAKQEPMIDVQTADDDVSEEMEEDILNPTPCKHRTVVSSFSAKTLID